jgi:hypothetical protein
MAASDQVTELTSFSQIEAIMAKGEGLYVYNKTRKPIKILQIDYPTAEGTRSFVIPRTTVSFNILDHIPAESLRQSQSFRKMFLAGAFGISDRETAEQDLSTEGARDAFDSAYAEANNTNKAREGEVRRARAANEQPTKGQNSLAEKKKLLIALDPALAELLGHTAENSKATGPTLDVANPRLAALEAKVRAGTIGEQEVLKALGTMLGDLDPEDLLSIASNPAFPEGAREFAANQAKPRHKGQRNRNNPEG